MYPIAASIMGRETDGAFFIVAGVAVALLAIITFLMLYFIFRYRKDRNPVATDIEGHGPIEFNLLAASIVLVLFLFYIGWGGYDKLKNRAPEGALDIRAFGQMWLWTFQYPNGRTSNVLNLPLGKPVKVTVSSRDVLHSLFVPAFRVKQDLLPGAQRALWFTPDRAGEYDIFCAEYCGMGHSRMLSRAVVMSEADFNAWLKEAGVAAPAPGAAPQDLAARGKELYSTKGCSACHSIDGTKVIGPTWKGMYGSKVKVTTSGKERETVVDDEYIKRSEFDPNADVVAGFQPVMPSSKGLLSEDEVKALIEFMKTLSGKPGAAAPAKGGAPSEEQGQKTPAQAPKAGAASAEKGKALFTSKGCSACHSVDGRKIIGPTLKGIYGAKVKVVTSGKEREVTVDDEYLKRSELEPNADIVAGFQPLMPPQKGILSEEEIKSLIEYVKTLK